MYLWVLLRLLHSWRVGRFRTGGKEYNKEYHIGEVIVVQKKEEPAK